MNTKNKCAGFLSKILPALILLTSISCQSTEELKSEQYFVEGYQLYTTHCANCHQAEGKGMSDLYPPMNGSSALADKVMLACIIQNGMKGSIEVNGKIFNRPMPPNSKLTEIEIAEIVSYVTMKWGKDSIYTNIGAVQKSLKDCKTY